MRYEQCFEISNLLVLVLRTTFFLASYFVPGTSTSTNFGTSFEALDLNNH
uniref:Uncharacterized protein n=1 Tax=Meloidogyne enterolobii TaxID=390850 RepID=A0A6V7UQM8_MELEN|nr:unnamed protein product [Meloidogyne enterolobii]